ncbi:MAG: amino acid adenylation domain-containing protein [Blastocatellia bacterium]
MRGGEIEYEGREDEQVKIRGNRVEIGEIEVAIREFQGVKDAVVLARSDKREAKRLDAFIVVEKGERIAERELKRYLRERLPDYMVPAVIAEIDQLPLSMNGKVDRKRLVEMGSKSVIEEEDHLEPVSKNETEMAGIWREVLDRDRVGIYDNFFDLGGHSLLATQIASRVRHSFEVEIAVRSIFESPTIAELLEQIEKIKLAQRKRSTPPFAALLRAQSLPLSFAQQRLWFLDQMEPFSAFYNMPANIRLTGRLSIEGLEQAINEVVRRHEVLRTAFPIIEGRPSQRIAETQSIAQPVVDLSALSAEAGEAEARRLVIEQACRPFDLSQSPLLLSTLLRLDPHKHALLLTMHHIISDGWSMEIWVKEVTEIYRAFSSGEPSSLPALPVQYADFALWQRQWLESEELVNQLSYWKQRLENALPVLELPTDYPRPPIQSFKGATQSFTLPKPLIDSLEAMSRSYGVTIFMTMLAGFKVLLARYTRQPDITVGAPVANRNRVEIEGLIGFFVNMLVLRSDLSGDPTVAELLRRVREVTLEAYENQDVPFERLVEELQPERSLSHQPLFQVSFQIMDAPDLVRVDTAASTLSLKAGNVDRGTTLFDLSISLRRAVNGLDARVEYSTDLFNHSTIARLFEHYHMLLEAFAANSKQHISSLPLLAPAQRHQILVEWNEEAEAAEQPQLWTSLFESQAAQRPDAVALVLEDEQVSYGKLNLKANQLARYLWRLGVGPEDYVGLFMQRTLEAYVAIIGILKSGGAYLPLDPAYPTERNVYILDDSKAKVLLSEKQMASGLERLQLQTVYIDTACDLIAQESSANPRPQADLDNVAYVIYTSGSTGSPKGVETSHRSIASHCACFKAELDLGPSDLVLLFSSFSFDPSVEQFLSGLMSGARHVIRGDEIWPSSVLARKVSEFQFSYINLPTAYWQQMSQEWVAEPASVAGCHVKTLLVGGDVMTQKALAIWDQLPMSSDRLINAYGPTEATITSTVFDLEGWAPGERYHRRIPIGRPVKGKTIYILDEQYRPAPIGVPGDLYIGGNNLARGYLNRTELSAEKFIPDPFGHNPGDRIYKTGDMAYYMPDGNIQFLRRSDQQTKIRGYRVEPGEIDFTLLQHPDVVDVFSQAVEDEKGDKRIVSYVVASTGFGDALSASQNIEAERVSQWQVIYDERVSNQFSEDIDPQFYITGWHSSYTGQSLPKEEMREWVDNTVNEILSLRPDQVMEIGCGSGLLLFRIAPYCARYLGTDFSTNALSHVENVLSREADLLPQVSLDRRMADNFEGIQKSAFDVVILNSIIQYFPGVDYLLRVLEGALESVKPGGSIFIGDVRSLPLLDAFHASVQLFQATDDLSQAQLRERAERGRTNEEELTIDPALFVALKSRFPQIREVEIRLKRGHFPNELNKYRYNVVLHVGGEVEALTEISWFDWQSDGLTPQVVRQLLREDKPECLGLARVPNARILDDVLAREWLEADEGPETVGRFRQLLNGAGAARGVDPETLWTISRELPYKVDIGWSNSSEVGSFDVVLTRATEVALEPNERVVPAFVREGIVEKPLTSYANNPMKTALSHNMIAVLREYLKERLPEYMVPSSIVLLDEMPLTPSGKLDRRALPAPDQSRAAVDVAYVEPHSEIERAIASVWQEVLNISRVGTRDNFFDLGGHSLLMAQAQSKLRKIFNRDISMIDLFQYTTISALARHIAGDGIELLSPEAQGSDERYEEGMNRLQRRLRQMKQSELENV